MLCKHYCRGCAAGFFYWTHIGAFRGKEMQPGAAWRNANAGEAGQQAEKANQLLMVVGWNVLQVMEIESLTGLKYGIMLLGRRIVFKI